MQPRNLQQTREQAETASISTYAFLAASIADVGITMVRADLEGIIVESNAIARYVMQKLGAELGIEVCLAGEYFAVAGLVALLPRKLKPLPLAAATFLHVSGFLTHMGSITTAVPEKVMLVNNSISQHLINNVSDKLMYYTLQAYAFASEIYHKSSALFPHG